MKQGTNTTNEKRSTANWLTLDDDTKTSVGAISDQAWQRQLDEFVELLAQGMPLPPADASTAAQTKIYEAAQRYENLKLIKLSSLIAMARIRSRNLIEKKMEGDLKDDIMSQVDAALSKRDGRKDK